MSRISRSESAERDVALTEERMQKLRQLENLGKWLDASIPVPGTNFSIGWDTLIGLIPGVGDFATAAISTWIVLQAKRLGASKWTLARMAGNVGIDALLGTVPLIGDVFDAAYKSNQKNIALLRRQLAVGPDHAAKSEDSMVTDARVNRSGALAKS